MKESVIQPHMYNYEHKCSEHANAEIHEFPFSWQCSVINRDGHITLRMTLQLSDIYMYELYLDKIIKILCYHGPKCLVFLLGIS